MDKRKVFECLLNQFETDEMRNYCADMIEKFRIISLRFRAAPVSNITTKLSANHTVRFIIFSCSQRS